MSKIKDFHNIRLSNVLTEFYIYMSSYEIYIYTLMITKFSFVTLYCINLGTL